MDNIKGAEKPKYLTSSDGIFTIELEPIKRLFEADPSKIQEIAASQIQLLTIYHNVVLDQAKNNWILFIDADERLTPELKAEIITTINNKDASSAYLIYRTFMFKNFPIILLRSNIEYLSPTVSFNQINWPFDFLNC